MQWDPESLASDAGGTLLRRGSRPIRSAFIDSRAPIEDGLFVPIVAARDGHEFIPGAISGGASAVLLGEGREAPPGDLTVVGVGDTLAALSDLAARRRDRFSGPCVAITGSNGKTTTRAMVEAVVRAGFRSVLCTKGNFNNHLGLPLTLLGKPHHADAMVLELGMSAPGENAALARIARPTVHVVTSVALEHLEFMGTIEAIAAAEAEPMAVVPESGAIVVPSDEPLLTPHVPSGPRCVRVGPDADADVRVLAVDPGPPTVATLSVGGREIVIPLRLFGEHNARNAASAIAVGLHLDIAIESMVEALSQVEPVGDRGRTLPYGEHLVIADCYNANPGSVDVALRSLAALRAHRPGPLIAVLGDMLELGPTEESLHRDAGKLASDLGIDAVVGVGARGAWIADEATVESHAAADADAAASWLRQRLDGQQPGAVLIKASRGMKLERVLEVLGLSSGA